jgi:hypothetical protein
VVDPSRAPSAASSLGFALRLANFDAARPAGAIPSFDRAGAGRHVGVVATDAGSGKYIPTSV